MHILSPDQIEACCQLVNTRVEETRDGQRGPLSFRDSGKLTEIIQNLCRGQLKGYVDEPTLTDAFAKWRRKQNVAETHGENPNESSGDLDDIAAGDTIEEASMESAVLAMLVQFLGEEGLFSRKTTRKRTMRTMREGETAVNVKGSGSAVVNGELIDWLNFAVHIHNATGALIAVLPDRKLVCISRQKAILWRYWMPVTVRDLDRLKAKISAAAALFRGDIAKQVAGKRDVSRALFSYHQRNFAKKTLANGGQSNFSRLKNLPDAG